MLYRLDRALEGHDTRSLDAIIDWQSVRRNLRDDMVAAAVSKLLPSDTETGSRFGADLLVAWGAALIDAATRGLLTSDALVRLYDERRRAGDPSLLGAIRYAFFKTPSRFDVEVSSPRDDARRFRFEMTLQAGAWRVSRLLSSELGKSKALQPETKNFLGSDPNGRSRSSWSRQARTTQWTEME
jgi:hypothetical protein